MAGGSRVSITGGVRRMIQNIKEITETENDEEVYAMLKECGMDPNETAQKLLLQDTFHEVKRKRDKRKESYREPFDARSRPAIPGRGGRGGRGNYPSRHILNDTAGRRNSSSGKENGIYQVTDKGNASSSPTTTETTSSEAGHSIGPAKLEHEISPESCTTQVSGSSGIVSTEETTTSESKKAELTSLISVDIKDGSASQLSALSAGQLSSAASKSVMSGAYDSASNSEPIPSLDSRIPGAVGAIKHDIGSQRTVVETTTTKVESSINKITSQVVPSSSVIGSSGSRPPSNYGNRSQQVTGPQKGVGPSKEWKPKSVNPNPSQPSEIHASDVAPITAETIDRSLPSSNSMVSDGTILKLEKRIEDLQLSEIQHVIIPHHLQVPESERLGLTFGSFDATFELRTDPTIEDTATSASEFSQDVEENVEELQDVDENVEELSLSIGNESPTVIEANAPDHSQISSPIPENQTSREFDVPSGVSLVTEHDPEVPQYSLVHSAPSYPALELLPQVPTGQFPPFESNESQSRDATRFPSIMVQPSLDPSTSFYNQIYRPSNDTDARFSPYLAPGGATKYNGNISVLPGQTSQSPQESRNFLVFSSASPTPLATQAVGVMQSSFPQQPAAPVFRQPGGVHATHYPSNFFPYSQYISPFYVPPPTLHHYLSSAAFPQQPPTSSIYPPPAVAPVKYPISQYKPGTNTGNSNHAGVPTGYGTYNSSPAGYNLNSTDTSGNSTGNEDQTASQFKENNVYITAQQSEGSAFWFPATAGRDIPGLQFNPFYNLPPPGQHMTFTPAQAAHGAITGVYHHPSPAVAGTAVHPLLQQSQAITEAVEMAGPHAGVYQQPQRAQINWANNY